MTIETGPALDGTAQAGIPPPPPGRHGWPWMPPPRAAKAGAQLQWPKLTVVTPSYNHAAFLERTIRSVLLQGYPNLEYIIMDGGSTDGSAQIIKKYEPWLAYWVSERDKGQVDAINRGLRRATGDWVAWQNSDDIYYPGALFRFAQEMRNHPQAGLVTANINLIDAEDGILTDLRYVRPTHESMLAEGMVLTNQAAFWKRDLHARAGYIDEAYDCAFDYDWFLRVLATARATHVDRTLGAFRIHRDAKTHVFQARYEAEKRAIVGDRALPRWKVRAYQARRIALFLAKGHVAYVTRAIVRRLRGVRKHAVRA